MSYMKGIIQTKSAQNFGYVFAAVKDNKLCCKGHILDLNVYYTCNKYKYVEKCLCLGTLKISYPHWENGFIR